jgi:AcrR family transcriptional regulator
MTESLTKTDWLDFALRELAQTGHGGLRALALARKLGVSRGSFYWHFRDVGDFEDQVIARWSAITNEALIASLAAEPDAAARLSGLLHRTFRSGSALERAMRAWATVDPRVGDRITAVDHRRIAYAEQVLGEAGLAPDTARARARLLYWAAIGRLMMGRADPDTLSDTEIDALCALVLS